MFTHNLYGSLGGMMVRLLIDYNIMAQPLQSFFNAQANDIT